MRRPFVSLFAILILGLIAGCTPLDIASPTPASSSLPLPTATPRPPLEQHLRQAFQEPDPKLRRQRVLDATDNFLRDTQIRATDDIIAAAYYADIAFSSGRLTLPYPVFLHRQDETAVITLPEGMGVYLYDLSQPTGTSPIVISQWAVGVTSLDVIWHEDAAGITFMTEGSTEITRIHYALATRGNAGWRVTWFSDEAPHWWFNAVGGSAEAEDDLSAVTVTGTATQTTDVFLDDNLAQRAFTLRWVRDGDSYRLDPSPEAFYSRRAWLWRVARPSAYTTLVEFMERLQYGERDGIQRLLVSPDILEVAEDFGLTRGERRYQIVSAERDQIVFRDLQGTFIVTFEAPSSPGEPWLIEDIAPPGAPEPTATPES